MSNEVAVLEAEIKEYKLQVRDPIESPLFHSLTFLSQDRNRPIRSARRPGKCRAAESKNRA